MLRMLNVLSIVLMAACLQAFAAAPEVPSSGATHRVQVLRAGEGEPRQRDTGTARTPTPSTPHQNQDKVRTRPYQAAKPGQGLPKGRP